MINRKISQVLTALALVLTVQSACSSTGNGDEYTPLPDISTEDGVDESEPEDIIKPANEISVTKAPNKLVEGMTMILIPGGEFQMGDPTGRFKDSPVHTVYVEPFWIDETEVTTTMFAALLNAKGNQEVGVTPWLNTYLEPLLTIVQTDDGIWQAKEGFENHPARWISWYGARAYCEWIGGRLPTEAEWEKAARGGLEGQIYPWGNDKPTCEPGAINGAQFNECIPPGTLPNTVPVGTFSSNGYGIYDMVGNVSEWTSSGHDPYPYDANDGREDLEDFSGNRVDRGGSFRSENDEYLNIGFHPWGGWSDSDGRIGLRCALSP